MDDIKTTWSTKHERLTIAVLCVIGAIRMFVFNAAFPPFNNVDEESHFDLVYKYAHGDIPKTGVTKYSRNVMESVIIYRTWEYVAKPEDRIPPPLWTIPGAEKSPEFANDVSSLQQHVYNHEAGSFPVYYLLAGLWYKTGEILGLAEGELIYWIRFLNVPLFVLLIIVSYKAAENLYVEGDSARIALPLLVTFFPQDAFYSIGNDGLSPLLFAISFLMLLQIYNHKKSNWYHFLAGLFIAATFLTKVSNITIMFLLGLVLLLKIKKLNAEKKIKQYLPKLAILLAASLIPAGVWLARNYFVIGDALASAEKIAYSGWTVKPVSEMLNHPIFTTKGAAYFLTELTKTFWRGEFSWHNNVIANYGMDIFYIISTLVLVLASGIALLVKGKTCSETRFGIGMSFFVLIVSIFFLATLSILFDFGNWPCPSREKPYFTTGRLIGGVLLPFLIIYLDGLRRLLSFLKSSKYLLLAAAIIVIAITWSEISISMDVFKSQYNWFHLK